MLPMNRATIRAFSCCKSFLSARGQNASSTRGPVAPFVPHFGEKIASIDRTIGVQKRLKAWEKDGEDKDTWFRRKYAHVHVKQKARRQEKQQIREEREAKRASSIKSDFRRDPIKRLEASAFHEYVYGTAPVLAALESQKRGSFSELLYHNPKAKHSTIMKLAKQLEIPTTASTKMDLNQLTNNNVHNGYVLKTKPFVPTELRSLGVADGESGVYAVHLTQVGSENVKEKQVIRQNENEVDLEKKRFPLGLYLDEISDPHNVGAMIRSAYYLGVDFVVMSEKNCSSLTPSVAKASSGAMEFLPIYTTGKAMSFIDNSRQNGWSFITGVSPLERKNKKSVEIDELHHLLSHGPCMLVIGSEGAGVRPMIQKKCDFLAAIPNGRLEAINHVDSLNASVAASLLIQRFLA